MTDKLSILRHPVSPLAKTWNADGTITGYGDAKYFRLREVEVAGLADLSELLLALEDQSTTVVIRGKYVGDRLARERDGTEFQPGKVRRSLDYFDDQPMHSLLADIDKFTPLCYDPLTQPVECIDEYIQTMLPDEFAGAGYHWQLSNSHGHPTKAGTLNAHVWMWSKEAYTSAQLKAHADEVGLATDKTLFNTVQAHYTAAPVFDGAVDPVELAGVSRSGFVSGLLADELELRISDSAKAAAGVGGSASRAQRMRDLADADLIARTLTDKGLVKSYSRDGSLNITCPFDAEHTGASGETATQYFLPNTGGHALGQFKCLHSHCSGRKRSEFVARLGIDENDTLGMGFDDVRGEADSSPGGGGPKSRGFRGRPSKSLIPEAKHLCTDLANANRIAKYYGRALMVIADAWYTWSGKHWIKDDGDVWRDTARLSMIISSEEAAWKAKPAANDQERARNLAVAEALKKWGTASENTSKMSSAILILKKTLTVDASKVDANEWLLNCNNGTVDVRTGLIRPHDPKDLITRLIETDYNPDAKAPVLRDVLAKITMEDGLGAGKPLAGFLKRWFGYCATGSVREHKFLVHYGQGSNGKSTLLDTMAKVLGDYSGTAAPGLMMATKSDKHPAEIADLFGKRMVTAHETGDGGLLREDFVKAATGGDVIKARFMRENFFQWKPTHKLQLLTNYKPGVKGQDNGIWRRILLIPYQARFGTPEEFNSGRATHIKDTSIAEKLDAELEGVLAWIVAGAIEWYRDGLQEPDVVRLASDDYQGEQDRVKQYFEECCQYEKTAVTPLTGDFGVYESYRGWCKDAGFSPLAKTRFQNEMLRIFPGVEVREANRLKGEYRRKHVCYGLKLLESD